MAVPRPSVYPAAPASEPCCSRSSAQGSNRAEAELLREAEAVFRNAVRGLPPEVSASNRNYIRFVRSERRKRARATR